MELPKDYTATDLEQLFINGAVKFLKAYNGSPSTGNNKLDYANSRKYEVIANYLTKRQEIIARSSFKATPGEQTVIDYGLNLVDDEDETKCA